MKITLKYIKLHQKIASSMVTQSSSRFQAISMQLSWNLTPRKEITVHTPRTRMRKNLVPLQTVPCRLVHVQQDEDVVLQRSKILEICPLRKSVGAVC